MTLTYLRRVLIAWYSGWNNLNVIVFYDVFILFDSLAFQLAELVVQPDVEPPVNNIVIGMLGETRVIIIIMVIHQPGKGIADRAGHSEHFIKQTFDQTQRIVIIWAAGGLQGFGRAEVQEVIACLPAMPQIIAQIDIGAADKGLPAQRFRIHIAFQRNITELTIDIDVHFFAERIIDVQVTLQIIVGAQVLVGRPRNTVRSQKVDRLDRIIGEPVTHTRCNPCLLVTAVGEADDMVDLGAQVRVPVADIIRVLLINIRVQLLDTRP